MSESAAISFAAVDADNPWPGLASYTEQQSRLFHGRDEEILDLTQLAERRPLVVLFGQSGLGKSSILQAGVFPRLRADGFCPVYVRLDHSEGAPSPTEQIKELVRTETAKIGTWTKPGIAQPGESLWEFFHHRGDRLIDRDSLGVVPVLVFDQFEELFTLGAAKGERRDRAVAFISELAELVENRPSAKLVARLEKSSEEMEAFDFGRTDYRVIISLREDFLPDLETLKTIMPALMQKRMRLSRMTGTQALEAVVKPGGALVTPEVAQAIVEFVSGARGGSAERLAELDVEPPLLSVICRELNERRRSLGQAQITADLVSGNRREILNDFYERSVADVPAGMRTFVEDHLLTKSGFRDNLALETALEFPGVTRPLIDTLVSRRLLRIEDRLGVQRVELTHDVLAEVIRASRDARRQRLALRQAQEREQQTRRRLWLLRGLAAGLALLLAGATGVAWRAIKTGRAEAVQSSRTDFVVGSQMLDDRKVAEGLAYLVRAARSDPENYAVGPRLMSALAFRSYALPVGQPLQHPAPVGSASYSNDGRRCLTRAGDVLFLWDLASGKLLQTLDPGMKFYFSSWSPDNRRIAVAGFDSTVRIWDLETGRLLVGPLQHEQAVMAISFSPDGRWLCTGSEDKTAMIWDSVTGELGAKLQHREGVPGTVFSPDGSRLLTWAWNGEWGVWTVPNGTRVTPRMKSERSSSYLPSFSPDGKMVAIVDSRNRVRLHDAATGSVLGSAMEHDREVYMGAFSRDGSRYATTSLDQTARIWEVPSGKLLRSTFDYSSQPARPIFTADGHGLITPAYDNTLVWDVANGRLAVEPIRMSFGDVSPEGDELVAFRGKVAQRRRISPSAVAPLQFSPSVGRRSVRRSAGMSTAWGLYADRLQEMEVLTGRPIGAPREFPERIPQFARRALNPERPTLSPDARHLFVTNEAGAQELWDLRGPAIVRHPLGRYEMSCWGFSSDSAWFAIAYNTFVQVWATATGQPIGGPLAHEKTVLGVQLAPEKRQVLVRAGDQPILWTLAGDKPVAAPLRSDLQEIQTGKFSPNGRLIAVGDWGSARAQLWDAETVQPVGPWLEHRDEVLDLAFTRDSRRLLTRARWAVRMWDTATGAALTEPMYQPLATKDPLAGAVLSDDETLIATWTDQGEVRVWESSSGVLIIGPIQFGRAINSLAFFSSDRFLTAEHPKGGFSVCPIPRSATGTRAPDWLLQLATAMAGGEIDARAVFRERAFDEKELDVLRGKLAAAPADGPFVDWGRWFLADRTKRPLGPGLKITAEEAKASAPPPDPIPAMTARAKALKEQGNFAEAEPLERQMLAWVTERDVEGDAVVAGLQVNLARTLLSLGKFEEAASLARAGLAVCEKLLAADSYEVADARGTLGSALVGQKRFAEAEPLLVAACESLRKLEANTGLNADEKAGLKDRATSLVQLYEATGRPEKAAEWRKFLATIPDAAPPAPAPKQPE